MSFEYYLHPHYIFNFLLSIVYAVLRNTGLKSSNLQTKDTWGFQREYSIMTGIATIILIRFLRYFSNYKKYINELLFYIKCGNAICLFFVDIRLFCWYGFACIVVWILFKPPMYSGPTKIIYVASEDIFREITKKKIRGADNYVFAIFYSNYSENCIFIEDLFAKLSLKYTTANLNFVKVDVDLVTTLAAEYKIVTEGFMSQLPVIVMFKNGEVEEIYPGRDEKGRPYQSKYYREKELIKIFDLENIYLNSVNLIPKGIK